MAELCYSVKNITDDKIRILENILWLNTPIDASLINLGIIAAPNICDNLPIQIEDGLEIYEVENAIYDNPDNLGRYPSKYWRTPTYLEMYYILNTRTNAANLRTLGRVEISSGVYRAGLFLLPDDWVLPIGVSMIMTKENYTTNTYNLSEFESLANAGAIFLCSFGRRGFPSNWNHRFWLSGVNGVNLGRDLYIAEGSITVGAGDNKCWGIAVRLCKNGSQFSISATTKIDFAPANLQYHCTQHVWRFAEHSYDIIGADNANISDSYNGWIDLFGYGTSGVNYSPTLHTTDNADYASGDISNTDNDWGVNEIYQKGDYDLFKDYDKEKSKLIYSR